MRYSLKHKNLYASMLIWWLEKKWVCWYWQQVILYLEIPVQLRLIRQSVT
jgi:hypothetical protein